MRLILVLAVILAASVPAGAIDQSHADKGQQMAARATVYLRSVQDESGGWAVRERGSQLPAITALVLKGMLLEPGIEPGDDALARGADWMLSFRTDDGGIHDGMLPSYNTSVCLSTLALLDTDAARRAIGPAQLLLGGLQYSESSIEAGDSAGSTMQVPPEHPYYGGVGYGSHSRPDLSNLQLMLQGLHDSGVSPDDPAFKRALMFLQRTQMLDSVNDMAYADGSSQGGFIYSTGPDSVHVGAGESKAGMIEETLDDGTSISRLRAYGSITYAGFKSYIYADLPRDDPRVEAALGWIGRHYTLDENPGLGDAGLYYYFVTFATALDAWDEPQIETSDGPRDWGNDLIDRLGGLQNEDGSFRPVDDRWMEGDQTLVTAYALIALQHALGRAP